MGTPSAAPMYNRKATREFSSLSAREALHIAVFIEERNAKIYREFAEMFAAFGDRDSMQISALFEDMEREERRHGALLQDRYTELYGTFPCSVTEDEVRQFIEVPRLDSEIFALLRTSTGRAPRVKAFELALAAEQGAMRYYTRLAEFTDDDELRAMYAELSQFESDHIEELEQKIEAARYMRAEQA